MGRSYANQDEIVGDGLQTAGPTMSFLCSPSPPFFFILAFYFIRPFPFLLFLRFVRDDRLSVSEVLHTGERVRLR